MRVGVLALQGDYAAHVAALTELGIASTPVRTAADLTGVDRLVLPGGESSAMLKLMAPVGLDRAISERLSNGMPVLATCAGVILLASGVSPRQDSFGVLDVDVERNAYGRQVHSTVATVRLNGALGAPPEMEAVFIRAPRITRVGERVTTMAWYGSDPVLIASGTILASTFHPELSRDRRIHRLFCGLGADP
jgi:5'-phosphate synthase pdxT subunit